jgi:hypothetical protein
MGYLLRIIKKSFLWSYARNTWQWDVLCVLILIFIFMTPKSWFITGEREPSSLHQKEVVTTIVLGPEIIDNEKDTGQLERRVQALTGRRDAHIVALRPRLDKDGKTVGYEVDIR